MGSIVLVMRCVLCSVHVEEAGRLVGIDSCAGNVNIRSFSHVLDVSGDKLNIV